MAVKVFVPGHMPRNEAINVAGSTVGECLEHAVRLMPALRGIILDDDGGLSHGLFITVIANDAALFPAGPEQPVKDGDTIGVAFALG